MAKLETLHGVTVNVADEKVDRLLATGGYRRPSAKKDPADGYASQSKADLVAEIEKRNAGREAGEALAKVGNKADLVAVLEADDAASSGD